MKKKSVLILILVTVMSLIAGCAYPEDKLVQNQMPYADQVESVQKAVDQFQQDNGGILPIKTKEMDTPIYQKYLIDFSKIAPAYIAEAPGNAYESGGVFQYVLIDVETNPTVKIFDLRIAETIRDLNLRIKMQGFPPFKEKVAENVYTLDYEQLGFKEEPVVISPFTSQNLSYVITGDAEIYVDYRSDLYQIMQNKNHNFEPGDDIRSILIEESMFVPAYSLPYTIDSSTKEPIFLSK
ncbi:hypothetical protein [Bacillus dakarensis]|uniref:hypothetical protein n=1 Tax=Robertmurraya dakarensis TaxID=1926278 RepID=UPI000981F470|nr:hypothetical protein [Bacillus dakarensis]